MLGGTPSMGGGRGPFGGGATPYMPQGIQSFSYGTPSIPQAAGASTQPSPSNHRSRFATELSHILFMFFFRHPKHLGHKTKKEVIPEQDSSSDSDETLEVPENTLPERKSSRVRYGKYYEDYYVESDFEI